MHNAGPTAARARPTPPSPSLPSNQSSPRSHRPYRNSIIAHPHEYTGAKVLPTTPANNTTTMSGSESNEQLYQLYSPILNSPTMQEQQPIASSQTQQQQPQQPVNGSPSNDLVPQRSAPLPPGVNNNGGLPNSQHPQSYSKRTSYIRTAGNPNPTNLSGLPQHHQSAQSARTGLSALPSPSSSSAAPFDPPRPQRSHTTDVDTLTASAPPSRPVLPPHSYSQQPGVSAALHGLTLDSSSDQAAASSTNTSAANSPQISQSHFVSRSRDGSTSATRNTFKSVFGGFVNSMSGETHRRTATKMV